MAMEMETPMPAFFPAERLVGTGEVGCVLEIEVAVLFDELAVGELVVKRLAEDVNSANISEANNFNIAVSVLCQATGMPSQITV